MEILHSDIINDILPRYCEGTASVEECKLAEDWIARSDENYRIAKQIHTLYLATDTIHILTKINTEKAFTKVSQRMTVQPQISWLGWIQRIAAVLFIPVLITLLIQNFNLKPQLAQRIEIKTNPGMTTNVNLPDGSVVYLNSESSLSYPTSFDGDIRLVHLKGEAFFTVAKDETKRFIVSAPHNTRIEVVGTTFNMEAFEEDAFVSTTLIEGKVNFLYAKEDQSGMQTLKPGQKLIYDPVRFRAQVFTTTGEAEIAWKDGKIIFSDTPLPQALHMLEKRFHVEFAITNERLKKESFTGSFTHERLDRILEVFKISSNIKWRYIDTNNTRSEKMKIEIY